mmetsp:Transcript_89866/g.155578  ORF Transcript_89866/g.155578 Transcript_89866/m.155578 type:complete len:549 (+) Transcript_89866:182-1828(+)
MAKGWKIWGCVISLCVVWFWIICFWHIGEPSGSENSRGRRLVKKKDKSVMVLPPAMPATPKPRPVMVSGSDPQPRPGEDAPRRKPQSWSRWTEKVTTTTTSTTLPTTTIMTTSTTRHHYTFHEHKEKHLLADTIDWSKAGEKPDDSKKFGSYHAFDFHEDQEHVEDYITKRDWHDRYEAVDSVYAPLQKDERGGYGEGTEDVPDTIREEDNQPLGEAQVGYTAGELPTIMNDKQKDWHDEVVSERSEEYGREEPPDTTKKLTTTPKPGYAVKKGWKPKSTTTPTDDPNPPAEPAETTTPKLVEHKAKKGELVFVDKSLKEAEEFEKKDNKDSYEASGDFAGTSWWDHEEEEKKNEAKKTEEPHNVPKGKEARVEKLLKRAKEFKSPYFKDFEAAVKDDLVLDLMEDPFPVRWAVDGVDHSFAKAVKGSLLDDDHWLMFTMDTKLPPMPKNSKCRFEDDIDYEGWDVDHFEFLTDQACCDKCIEYGADCQVAVMSAIDDDPPRTCWLKSKIQAAGGQKKKAGVRACWKPGQSPTMIWNWRKIGDNSMLN